MSENFGDRLKRIREEREMSQEELAALLNTTKQVISRYENNQRTPKITIAQEYAQLLRVPLPYLLGDDTHGDVFSLKNVLPVPKMVKKPRLGAIACGKPILAVEDAEESDMVPEGVDCDFTLKCKGDSMITARIFDGDIVYIRSQPEVENGQIAAVRIGDEATLKKVYYTPDSDRLVLRACNPLYPDQVYTGPELDQVTILGLAVGFYSQVRHEM